MSLPRLLLAAAVGFLLVSGAEASAVYKWTDDKGVVQYTDSPPEGRAFVRLDIGGGVSRSSGSSDSEQEGVAEGEEAGPSKAQMRITNMRASCADARKNLSVLEANTRVSLDKDGDGKEELLSDAERVQFIAINRDLVERNCLPEVEGSTQVSMDVESEEGEEGSE